MDVVLLRLVHILCGVYWAGALIFIATMLEPSIRAAGESGAGVMPALVHRRFLTIMPIIAALTILSGIDLMRRDSAGFSSEWFSSPLGATLTVGAALALVAFVIGVGVMRPTVLRMGRLAREAAQTPDGGGEARQAEIAVLRRRSVLSGRAVAALLAATVIAMAIARYM